MINSVRNTVLAILNKNNYGYISPSDFNLFAKQAQMDIFEDYFTTYNYYISKQNARQSGTGYADIQKGIEEVIDYFSLEKDLIHNAANKFFLPSPTTTGEDYYFINKVLVIGTNTVEAENVSNKNITMLTNSLLTSPTELFPAYSQEGNFIYLYPNTINTQGNVRAQYIRYPKDPKWTYVSLSGGEPSFDQSQPDYQDFELPLDDENNLVNKILQYAGMSIREIQTVQFAQAEEQIDSNELK
jgi:hypothetical protein